MWSVPSRFSEASATARICRGRLSGPGSARFAEVAEFGGDHDLVAHRLKRLADDLLVGVGTVGLGGIEEGDAELVRLPQEGDRVGLLHRRAIGEVQSHAAEADRGDFEAAFSEFALLHCPCSCGFACMPLSPGWRCRARRQETAYLSGVQRPERRMMSSGYRSPSTTKAEETSSTSVKSS